MGGAREVRSVSYQRELSSGAIPRWTSTDATLLCWRWNSQANARSSAGLRAVAESCRAPAEVSWCKGGSGRRAELGGMGGVGTRPLVLHPRLCPRGAWSRFGHVVSSKLQLLYSTESSGTVLRIPMENVSLPPGGSGASSLALETPACPFWSKSGLHAQSNIGTFHAHACSSRDGIRHMLFHF